ncbi:hypothetical protein MNB_SV-12-1596 [hydrothermal vent metagenome]|uniref:Uncharacterized protein n=1 Tax=hydrothermal vent metagenome TaxID=652676 RepID=A0A1W1CBY7_9ZZZZ
MPEFIEGVLFKLNIRGRIFDDAFMLIENESTNSINLSIAST